MNSSSTSARIEEEKARGITIPSRIVFQLSTLTLRMSLINKEIPKYPYATTEK